MLILIIERIIILQRMVNYSALTDIQRIVMAAIVISTNSFGIPSIVSLFRRKGLQFEAMVVTMAVLTSTMYHLCEVLHCQLFLEELKWHRLDNIFVITGIGMYVLHVTGSGHARKTMYFLLVCSILSQEKDPWNLTYTILPIVFYDILAVFVKILYWNQVEVTYNYRNLAISLGVLAVGGYFFVKGLDQYDDYLRFNHGIWHLMAAVSNYYGMNATVWKQKNQPAKEFAHKNKSSIQFKQF